MKSTFPIFVFTKNRENTLANTVRKIPGKDFTVFIIDDSTETKAILANKEICIQNNYNYYGLEQQKELLHKINSIGYTHTPFISLLGNENWNLAYARNHALLLCSILNTEKCIFLDDDIAVPSPSFLQNIFELLKSFNLVGADVKGMVDDSILGHVASGLGFYTDRVFSGGCIGFQCGMVANYFMNVYNEDWIWQYMHGKISKIGYKSVKQFYSDPLENYEKKTLFQEKGEIIVTGLAEIENPSITRLKDQAFWANIQNQRVEFLKLLLKFSKGKRNKKYAEIINTALTQLDHNLPVEISNMFENYVSNNIIFSELRKKLSLGNQLVI